MGLVPGHFEEEFLLSKPVKSAGSASGSAEGKGGMDDEGGDEGGDDGKDGMDEPGSGAGAECGDDVSESDVLLIEKMKRLKHMASDGAGFLNLLIRLDWSSTGSDKSRWKNLLEKLDSGNAKILLEELLAKKELLDTELLEDEDEDEQVEEGTFLSKSVKSDGSASGSGEGKGGMDGDEIEDYVTERQELQTKVFKTTGLSHG